MNLCKEYLLIVGATPDIGLALARRYASAGYNLHLTARNIANLDEAKRELSLYPNVHVVLHELDILNIDAHKSFYDALTPKPTGVIVVAGLLGIQQEAETHFGKAKLKLVYFISAYTLLISILC